MPLTETQARDQLILAFGEFLSASASQPGRVVDALPTTSDSWGFAESLYTPDTDLASRIAEYNQWIECHTGEDRGRLMEQIGLLAFRCLKGWQSIKSYQSYAPQHDLVISGSGGLWFVLMACLHLPISGRTILVECKNLENTVSEAQLARVCSIVDCKFPNTCHLAVILSHSTASGFPARDSAGMQQRKPRRSRSLRDARATQVLFHAKTAKYVVVLDHHDIQALSEPGGLPRLLEAKVRDVEEVSGLPLEFDEDWKEIDLPPHLSQYLESPSRAAESGCGLGQSDAECPG